MIGGSVWQVLCVEITPLIKEACLTCRARSFWENAMAVMNSSLLALQSKDREDLKGGNDKRNIWNRRILFPSRVMIYASRHQTLWLPILFWPHHGVRAIVRVSPRVSFHLRVHSSRKEQLPFLHGSMTHGGDAPNTRVKCALDKLEFQVSFRVAYISSPAISTVEYITRVDHGSPCNWTLNGGRSIFHLCWC